MSDPKPRFTAQIIGHLLGRLNEDESDRRLDKGSHSIHFPPQYSGHHGPYFSHKIRPLKTLLSRTIRKKPEEGTKTEDTGNKTQVQYYIFYISQMMIYFFL